MGRSVGRMLPIPKSVRRQGDWGPELTQEEVARRAGQPGGAPGAWAGMLVALVPSATVLAPELACGRRSHSGDPLTLSIRAPAGGCTGSCSPCQGQERDHFRRPHRAYFPPKCRLWTIKPTRAGWALVQQQNSGGAQRGQARAVLWSRKWAKLRPSPRGDGGFFPSTLKLTLWDG